MNSKTGIQSGLFYIYTPGNELKEKRPRFIRISQTHAEQPA